MPIIKVTLIGTEQDYPEDLAQNLADAIGIVLDSPPQGTWVSLYFLPKHHYAENGGAGDLPIIVNVTESDSPTDKNLERRVAGLTEAVSKAAVHPAENVHIMYDAAARHRIAFGGNLLK